MVDYRLSAAQVMLLGILFSFISRYIETLKKALSLRQGFLRNDLSKYVSALN